MTIEYYRREFFPTKRRDVMRKRFAVCVAATAMLTLGIVPASGMAIIRPPEPPPYTPITIPRSNQMLLIIPMLNEQLALQNYLAWHVRTHLPLWCNPRDPNPCRSLPGSSSFLAPSPLRRP